MPHSSDGSAVLYVQWDFFLRGIFVRYMAKYIIVCNVMRHMIVNTLKKDMHLWQVMTIE